MWAPKMVADYIIDVDFSKKPYTLKGDSGQVYTCDSLIICTGALARWLGDPSEKNSRASAFPPVPPATVSSIATRKWAVIGGGNTAVEEALFLTNFASKVTLNHRRDELRAEKILQDRLLAHEKIEVMWDHELDEVLGDENPLGVTGVRLKSTKTGETTEIRSTACSLPSAMPRRPNCSRASWT